MQLLNIFAKGLLGLTTKLCTKKAFCIGCSFLPVPNGEKENLVNTTIDGENSAQIRRKLKLPPLSEQGHFLKKAV